MARKNNIRFSAGAQPSSRKRGRAIPWLKIPAYVRKHFDLNEDKIQFVEAFLKTVFFSTGAGFRPAPWPIPDGVRVWPDWAGGRATIIIDQAELEAAEQRQRQLQALRTLGQSVTVPQVIDRTAVQALYGRTFEIAVFESLITAAAGAVRVLAKTPPAREAPKAATSGVLGKTPASFLETGAPASLDWLRSRGLAPLVPPGVEKPAFPIESPPPPRGPDESSELETVPEETSPRAALTCAPATPPPVEEHLAPETDLLKPEMDEPSPPSTASDQRVIDPRMIEWVRDHGSAAARRETDDEWERNRLVAARQAPELIGLKINQPTLREASRLAGVTKRRT
jgi:hypothetical protein